VRRAVVELVGVASAAAERPLRSLDLTLGEGDAVVVLGLPGAGKTSLLRLIAGLDDVSAGAMRFFGEDLATLPFHVARSLRDRVAVVFERGGIWANRTVAENLVLPVAYRSNKPLASLAKSSRLTELLAAVGLDGVSERATVSLDDSERRRVLLVRALLAEPEVLLFDEPQSALARAHQRSIAALLEAERRRRSLTVLFTDNDGRIDPYEADRPVVMHDRRIVPGAVRLPERAMLDTTRETGREASP
jgi:ABC-type methionine transport system ATPase subunit